MINAYNFKHIMYQNSLKVLKNVQCLFDILILFTFLSFFLRVVKKKNQNEFVKNHLALIPEPISSKSQLGPGNVHKEYKGKNNLVSMFSKQILTDAHQE